jgi:hypothetical protein
VPDAGPVKIGDCIQKMSHELLDLEFMKDMLLEEMEEVITNCIWANKCWSIL